MVNLTPESVLAREAELRRIIQEATAELEEIPAVKRYMARLAAQAPKTVDPPPDPPPGAVEPPSVAEPEKAAEPSGGRVAGLTRTLMAVLASGENPWMTAKQIQTAASAMLSTEVKMSSISPKLWELAKKGIIRRDDMLVALTNRVGRDPVVDLLS